MSSDDDHGSIQHDVWAFINGHKTRDHGASSSDETDGGNHAETLCPDRVFIIISDKTRGGYRKSRNDRDIRNPLGRAAVDSIHAYMMNRKTEGVATRFPQTFQVSID
jgi:hypothetical protein